MIGKAGYGPLSRWIWRRAEIENSGRPGTQEDATRKSDGLAPRVIRQLED